MFTSLAAVLLSVAAIALIVTLAIRIPAWFDAAERIQNPNERIALQNELIKLQHSTLRDCILRKAIVFGTNLEGASLFGSDLTGALYASREQFDRALTDHTTRMPAFDTTPSETPHILPS